MKNIAMSLFQLVYISKASDSFKKEELARIQEKAGQKNVLKEVTGSLLYDAGRFIQILEGDKDTIKALFDKISLDQRHTDIRLLYFQEASKRLFPAWAMSMVNLDEDKPKNLSKINRILEEVKQEQSTEKSSTALKLFIAFQQSGVFQGSCYNNFD